MSRILSPVFLSFTQGQDGTATIALSPAEDVTGWTATFTVRSRSDATTALITKTTSSGITVSDIPNGVFVVTLDAADLAALTPGMYVWDLVRTNAGYLYPIADPGSLLITSSVYGKSAPTLTNVAELLAVTQDGTPVDADSTQLMFLLGAVESLVRRLCNRNFVYGTQTEYPVATWTNKIWLRETPVESITTLHFDLSAAAGQDPNAFPSTSLLTSGTDYYLDRDRTTDAYSNSGIVYRRSTVWQGFSERPTSQLTTRPIPAAGVLRCVYLGGYGNNVKVPMDLKLGIIDGVQMLRQVVDLGRMKQSESGEGYSYSLGPLEQELLRLGSIQQIVNSYRRIFVA